MVLDVGPVTRAVIGGTTAVIASAMTAERSVKGEPISVTADTVVTHAPTNIWDVVSQLGLWAELIILVPLVLGILLPGSVQFKHNYWTSLLSNGSKVELISLT